MSVYKPRKSPFYHYDFRLGGVRFSGSTREVEKSAARQIEAAERKAAGDRRREARLADHTEITRVFARFFEEKARHDKAGFTTLYRMERLQTGLTAILRARGLPATVGALDADIIAEYVARRRGMLSRTGKPLSAASVNRELQILRRILRRAAITWRLGNALPAWGDLMIAEADERIVTMGPDREAALLAALREDYRPAARFLILSGLRRGNVLPLPPAAVDFEQGIIVLRLKSKKPGGRLHILPMTDPMRIILAREIGRHPEAVFTYRSTAARDGRVRGGRYPIDAGTFQKEFKRAARTIGLPDLRVHDLRHVAGTRTLAATGNLRAAQQQLGHTRISTTTKYAHILLEETRAAMQAAHRDPPSAPEPAKKNIA